MNTHVNLSHKILQLRKVLGNNCRENQNTFLMSNAAHNTECNKGTGVQENCS
jgi:hypothetical protein